MSQPRLKSKVSQTASYTCFCWAYADAERDERFRGPDSKAKKFLTADDGTVYGRINETYSIALATVNTGNIEKNQLI